MIGEFGFELFGAIVSGEGFGDGRVGGGFDGWLLVEGGGCGDSFDGCLFGVGGCVEMEGGCVDMAACTEVSTCFGSFCPSFNAGAASLEAAVDDSLVALSAALSFSVAIAASVAAWEAAA